MIDQGMSRTPTNSAMLPTNPQRRMTKDKGQWEKRRASEEPSRKVLKQNASENMKKFEKVRSSKIDAETAM